MATSPQSAANDRWEFRVWLPPDVADNPLADWHETGEDIRTDCYLLVPDRSDLIAKLRGSERFDIKQRVDLKPPFERWSVALSSAFPLSADACAKAGALLVSDQAALSEHDGKSVAGLVAALKAARPEIELRTVAKVRHRFEKSDLMAEWTTVTVEETGVRAITLAFEAVDLEALAAMVDRLGMTNTQNRNYGAWLLSL